MKRKITLIIFSMLIIMSMMITSCTPAEPTNEKPAVDEPAVSEPEEPAPIPGESDEVVELVFMRFSEGNDVELDLIEEFNAAHPNIHVTADTVPANDNYQKLVLTTEAGQAPDVFMTFWTLGAASNNLALNLDPLIEKEGKDWYANYHEGGWIFHQWAGSNYAVPWRLAVAMVTMNLNLLEKADLEIPPNDWTWDDYISYANALTNPENNEWGICQMGSAEDPGTDYQFYSFLFQAGGKMINDEGLAGFNTPEGIEALQFMVDFIDSFMVPPGTTAATANVCHDLLAADKAGTWIDASLWAGIIRNMHPEANITLVPVPQYKRAAALIGGTGLGIASTSKHPEEAFEFIKFMVSDDAMLRWSSALGFTPPNISLLTENPKFANDPEQQRVLWAMNNQKLYPLSGYPDNAELESILRSYLQAAYLGQVTPEAALAGAEEEWNVILKKYQDLNWWAAWED